MRKIIALATVATGALALAGCTSKPAENAAAPTADANAMAAPEAMNGDNAMDANAADSNAMADNNATDSNAMAGDNTEAHTASGGH
jgi:hypothetical protein